jgi:hypothetical protein
MKYTNLPLAEREECILHLRKRLNAFVDTEANREKMFALRP